MPKLTRRRYPERQDCWHVYFGDVGQITNVCSRLVVGQFDCGEVPAGKGAVWGAYSGDGDNCSMQLRR